MSPKRLDQKLDEWSAIARQDSTIPDVDVRARVAETLWMHSEAPRLDAWSLGFCAVSVTIAVGSIVACYSAWQTIREPWAVYFF